MEINVVSETITTHKYELEVLAKAFSEITGIKLKHYLIQEGDVIVSCKPKCNRDAAFMTPISTTPI